MGGSRSRTRTSLVRIFAYCTEAAAEAVGDATGTIPFTSPPWTDRQIRPEMLEGQDLIYIRLHGRPGLSVWVGQGRGARLVAAFSRANLEGVDLGGAVVVLANCYGAESPMMDDLLEAGASAVIAGYGPNYAAANAVIGADLLVRALIRGLARGWPIRRAFRWARLRLLLGGWHKANRDAYQFVLREN